MRKIVEIHADSLSNKLKEMGVFLSFSQEALDLISNVGYDPQFGARPVKRVLQKEVVNALSKSLLAGEINRDDEILVVAPNGFIRFENQKVAPLSE